MRLRLHTPPLPAELAEELDQIPGVHLNGDRLDVQHDAWDVVREMLEANGCLPMRAPRVSEGRLVAHPRPEEIRGWDGAYPYQRQAALDLAAGTVSGLWHATGLGKTSEFLLACELLGRFPALVVTRAIGRESYARDAGRVGGRKVAIVVGRMDADGTVSKSTHYACRRANKALERLRSKGSVCQAFVSAEEALAWGAEIVVVGWETLAAPEEQIVTDNQGLSRAVQVVRVRPDLRRRWPICIADEHHYAKGAKSERTRALMDLHPLCEIRWSLTATPVADRLRDLHAQIRWVSPESADNAVKWLKRYVHATEARYGGLDTTGPHKKGECARCDRMVTELKRRCARLYDVKTRALIADQLPPMTVEVRRVPRELAAKAFAAGRGKKGLEGALAQSAEAKTDVAVDMAAEALIGGGKVVLVGNRHEWVPRAIAKVRKALENGPRGVLDKLWLEVATGTVPTYERVKIAGDYMAQPGPAILIATLDSISDAIDLQDTDLALGVALPYTPRQLVQLRGRFSRPGQLRPVLLVFFVAEGTVDEQIESLLELKGEIVKDVGADTLGAAMARHGGRSDEQIVAELEAWLKDSAPADDEEEDD